MQAHTPRLLLLASLAFTLTACSHPGGGDSMAAREGGGGGGYEAAAAGESAASLLRRAGELRASGRMVQALSVLAEAHQRDPQDAAIASHYGRLALILGHEEVAAPLLAQAVAVNPRDWRALSAQGVLESRRGRLPDGRRALARASMVSASEAVILNNLGVAQLLDCRPAAAASLLRQGLAAPELQPAHERRLRRNLALALAAQGRFEEADRLAGETLPRDIAAADGRRLRSLLGVSEAARLAESGWQARYVSASRPGEPAWQ